MDSFGTKLYSWRMKNGKSQNDVAQALNCSRRTVSAWESDQKLPGYDSIIAVAVLMQVSADWLLGIETPSYKRPHKRSHLQ